MNYNTEIENLKFNIPKNYRTLFAVIGGSETKSDEEVDVVSLLLLKEQVEDVPNTLTERESKVLQLRFGLDGGKYRTLEEVGRELGVTRERIRSVETKALRKLRQITGVKDKKYDWTYFDHNIEEDFNTWCPEQNDLVQIIHESYDDGLGDCYSCGTCGYIIQVG